MNKLLLFSIAFLAICAICVYNLSTRTYISAKFSELRPIKGNLKVYYKGLVVGRAREMWHNNSYSHSFIKLVLYPKNLMLPKNTEVYLKREKKNQKEFHDFLELVYPKEPSNVMLSNGAIIDGVATVDVDTFMKNQHPDDIRAIRQNLYEASENLNSTLSGLSEVFNTLNEILEDNRKNIQGTTRNIENMTQKVNNSVEEIKLRSTLSNVENSTLRLNDTIENFSDLIPSANSTLCELEGTLRNVNVITCGVRKTLNKPLGGFRLLFGKVID